MVYADDGSTQDEFAPELTLRIASAWSGQSPTTAKVEEKVEEDQWTVSGEFEALRPLRKYSWPDGMEVYVSAMTGQVVQCTTRAARLKAYCGPASALATVAAILGMVAGVWSYSPSERYRRGEECSSIPYVGTKRWHMILGLAFGPLACTWAFSGMLSMDPFPQLRSADSTTMSTPIAQALHGLLPPMSAFASKSPEEALLELGSDFRAKELEMTSFGAGLSIWLLRARTRRESCLCIGQPVGEFDRQSIVDRLLQAEGPDELEQVRLVTQYEAYYVGRRSSLALPVLFVQLKDRARSAYYIDPKTAQVVQAYDARSKWNRWLYHGLHSMDLPWLYRHRAVWTTVILALLSGGAALCVTSLMLAWGVLHRTLRRTAAPP